MPSKVTPIYLRTYVRTYVRMRKSLTQQATMARAAYKNATLDSTTCNVYTVYIPEKLGARGLVWQSLALASLVPRPSNRGGKAWYTLFAHAFNLNVNITSILIVTFANGLGLTDDVCVNKTAYACMRAIKGLTTSTPQLFPLSTSPFL